MGAASFLQTSFLGGEWSPLMQGRIDLPKYRTAMNVCVNIIPMEEGAAPRRSGTRQLGPTLGGLPGRVIGYAPQQNAPYIMEFTAGHLRFWQGYSLVLDGISTVVGLDPTTPAVLHTGNITGWVTGDQIQFFAAEASPTSTGQMLNRQFTVVQTADPYAFTLIHSGTNAPIDGTTLGWTPEMSMQVGLVLDLATPWGGDTWQQLRWVPFTDNQNETQGVLLSGQEPNLLRADNVGVGLTNFSLSNLSLIDGPYFDPITGAVATPVGGTSNPVYRISGGADWSSSVGYYTGLIAMYNGYCYMSTIGSPSVHGNGTNQGNLPGDNSAWVLVNFPAANAVDVASIPAWDGGTAYNPWNTGGGAGSIVAYAGQYWAAMTNGYYPFQNHAPGTTPARDWIAINATQVSASLSGVVGLAFSFAPWGPTTLYAEGDVAASGGVNYKSLQDGNLNQNPSTNPAWWTATNAALSFGRNGVQSNDVGRQIRLFYQPVEWNVSTGYSSGQQVTYAGAYYSAINDNTGAQPDLNLTKWLPVGGAAFWTTAVITAVNSPVSVSVQITGQPLTDATPITVFSAGVYTSSGNQWPTCGCFYQGRLWLAGAVANRIDSSTSDDPLSFTPTGPDGTVADNNGISLIMNTEDSELIQWMRGTQQGILVGTLSREWLINASTTADPITPATVEINPVTHYGSAFVEPKVTGLATVFVQKFKRKLMEMVANVFSGKYNAPNLALTAKHITAPGIEEITYQEELSPVLWARMADGSLAGCTYRRISAFQTDNPVMLNEPSTFAAWHRHELGTGRTVQSITTTMLPDGSMDQLGMVTQDTQGNNWVEVLIPLADTDNTIFNAWYLDGATTPTGVATATYGGTTYTRCYGLSDYVGQTVTVWATGLDCGDYTVNSLGYVDVPFGAAGGLYTQAWITANQTNYGDLGVPLDESVTITPPATTTPFTFRAYLPTGGVIPDTATGQVDFGTQTFISVNETTSGSPGPADGIRVYNTSTGETSQALSSALLPGGGTIRAPGAAGCLGGDGYYYFISDSYLVNGVTANGRLRKLNLTTMLIEATLGTGVAGGFPQTPGSASGANTFAVDMTPLKCNGTTYLLATNGPNILGGATAVFNANNMTFTGFTAQMTGPGTSENMGVFCTGHVGTDFGSAYGVDTWNDAGSEPYFNLYELVVTAAGQISMRTVGQVGYAALNPAWTGIVQPNGIVYDPTDGNVIVLVSGTPGPYSSVLAKLQAGTGAVLWSVPVSQFQLAGHNGLGQCLLGNGLLTYSEGVGSPSSVITINTSTGAIITTLATPGVTLGPGSYQACDSVNGQFVGYYAGTTGNSHVGYNAAVVGSPTNLPGTPTVFTGWGALTAGNAFTGSAIQTTRTSIGILIGSCFTSQGQIVRGALPQETGSRTGPAQGQTRRTHMFSSLLYNTQGVSFGTDFQHLDTAQLSAFESGPIYPVTKLYSGVYWGTVDDGYSFDGMLCWQVTRPYPATIVNIGGWVHTQER